MNTPFTIRLAGPITDAPRTIHGTASQLANAGATLAADHAARLIGVEWKAMALQFLRSYLNGFGCCTFQCSDIRMASSGFVPAHPDLDPRAWGAVIQAAHKEGWIKPVGIHRTSRKISHGRMETLWQYIPQ